MKSLRRTSTPVLLASLIFLAVPVILLGAVLFDSGVKAAAKRQLVAALETGTALAPGLWTATATLRPNGTLPPTWTPPDTETITSTPSPWPTDTLTPPPTATPSATPISTDTPLATLTATWTASSTSTATFVPTIAISPTPTFRLPSGAPSPVPEVAARDYDIFNILLIGSDIRPTDSTYRTDTLIIVSLNRTTGTVAMLSVPRDLYVYIPRSGYNRINTASELGDWNGWPGKGPDLLINTLTAYLGIPIQRYARVNFDGFTEIVDAVDGIDVANDCPLTDNKMNWPELSDSIPGNIRPYTLPVGMHHFSGPDALWYARSRESTSDFDRARRQQIILRAIWHKLRSNGLLEKLPDLWPKLMKIVDTNLSLVDILSLLPFAADLDQTGLRNYVLGPGEVSDWTTPEGAEVLLPHPVAIRALVERFYTPPTQNRLGAEKSVVEVVSSVPNRDWNQVAAARLAWDGFSPVDKGPSDGEPQPRTLLYDLTGGAKPANLALLARMFSIRKANILSAPDPERSADFRLVIGNDYNSCTYN